MHLLAALGEQDRPLSELMAGQERYVASGEVNSRVGGRRRRDRRVEAAFAGRPGVEVDRLDGLTVTHAAAPMWWFNLRPSNTEPLLRLNAEAADAATMAAAARRGAPDRARLTPSRPLVGTRPRAAAGEVDVPCEPYACPTPWGSASVRGTVPPRGRRDSLPRPRGQSPRGPHDV